MILLFEDNERRTVNETCIQDVLLRNKKKTKTSKRKTSNTLFIVLNAKEKALLVKELSRTGRISNLRYSTPIIDKNEFNIPKRITNHKQFVDYMITKDFRFIFEELKNWELDKFYPCLLVEGNFAWISKDENDVYRYYTKMKDGYATSFSLFDLVELREQIGIGTKLGFVIARRKVAELLNINYKEREWENAMINKYNKNLTVVGQAQFSMKNNYPALFELIKEHLIVLEHMNVIGLSFLSDKKDSVKKEAVFFASASYIADFIYAKTENKIQRDKVTRAINQFASLGLINKVKEKDIPSELLETAKVLKVNHPEFQLVNFYTINEYTAEVLFEANKRAQKLIEHKITSLNKVTEENIAKVLGKVIAKSVYAIKTPLTEEEQKIKAIKKARWEQKQKEYEDIPF